MKREKRFSNVRHGLFACLLVCAFLMLFAVMVPAAEPIRLTLKEKVTVDGDTVRLSDVATLSGGENTRLKLLGETEVAQSPLPGQTRFVGSDYIRIRLRQAGIDVKRLIFQGGQDVSISRKAVPLPVAAIKHAVETAIRSRMPWRNEAVTISDIRFDETIQLPAGRITHRIVPIRNEDYLGRAMLALHLFVDDEPARKIWVNADISVMADVVTVVRPLGKHQRIEMADLAVTRRDLADLASDTVRSVEEALGNRTTRMIYPDTVLQTGMIAQPPLVRRGDIVKIIASAGPMTITATGQAKQQGAKGDMVRVINTDSNRVITARVTGPGAVEIDF
jgi:flagella basal body P-ring formation protein FlgA